jgi:hypothetical protein
MQTLYLQVRAELRAQSRPLPELGSRGSPGLICIARNRSRKRAAGPPPPSADTPPPAPAPRRPADLPARMPALVRECLLRPPQSDRLHIVQAGRPESRHVRKARTTHRLDEWEELIAVWQWSAVHDLLSPTPGSLVFTSRGIRIAHRNQRLDIPYSEFGQYTFSSGKSEHGGRQYASYNVWLVISGPTSWSSPGSDGAAGLIARDLNQIRELAAG